MSEITAAIKARQTQIAQLQSDIETLQRAATIMGGGENTPAKAVRQKVPSQPKTKAQPQPQPKRRRMTAAQRAAVGKWMKASWAKRKKASAAAAATPARTTTTQKRTRKPMSAAAKKAMSKRMKASWAKRKRARR